MNYTLDSKIDENAIFTKQQDLLNFLMSDKENGVKVITEDPLYQLSINYYRVFVERISRQRGAWQMKMLLSGQ